MYAVGEHIVHPMHGAGTIAEIVEQKIGGESKSYFVLQLQASSVRVLIPTEGCDAIGIRPVLDRSRADAVIDAFATIDIDECPNWNKRYRDNMLRLKSGDLMEVARVVKSLMLRDMQRTLSAGERKMLTIAKQILLSELELATEQPHEAIEAILLDKLRA